MYDHNWALIFAAKFAGALSVRKALSVVACAAMLLMIGCGRNSSNKEVAAALETGDSLRQRIDQWKTDHGAYPKNLSALTDGGFAGWRYVKATEDAETYYLRFDLGGRREMLLYFNGPLYPNNGWFHRGYNIEGIDQLETHPVEIGNSNEQKE